MHKVGIIVINYNGLNVIRGCLAALETQEFQDFELIIVDNGSEDGSLQELEGFSSANRLAGPVRIIPLKENRGFAGGNVTALSYIDSPYIALLNNDAVAQPTWLGNLVTAMNEAPDVGICASKMLVYGTTMIDSAGDGFSSSLKGFKRGEGLISSSYDKFEYVFGACAGAALYRREMLDQIGFLDDDFFLIHEDTDLNFRAQLAGWKVLYVPSSVVHHKVRSTIGSMSDTAVYYSLRNSEFVRMKNVPFKLFLRTLPEFILGTLSEFFYFVIRYKKLKLYVKAKIDAVRSIAIMRSKRKKIMTMKKVKDGYLRGIMTPVWKREFILGKLKKLFFE